MKTTFNVTITEDNVSLAIEHSNATPPQLAAITAITAQTLNSHIDELKMLANSPAPPATESMIANGQVIVAPGGPFELRPAATVADQPASQEAEVLHAEIQWRDGRIKELKAQSVNLNNDIYDRDILIAELRQSLSLATHPPTMAEQPAPRPTPEIGGLPVVEPEPAAANGKVNGTQRKPATAMSSLAKPERPRLGFDEFDKLARAEMKRLAPSPNTMPSYKLWDELRDQKLPTMLAVIRRYSCANSAELATKLNMEPPLGRQQLVNLDTGDEDGEDGDE